MKQIIDVTELYQKMQVGSEAWVSEVSVEVKDINETLVSEASFRWFIQVS